MSNSLAGEKPHSSHWGAFFGRWEGGRLAIRPHPDDPCPSPLLENIPSALTTARIARPLVRKGWLENGPGADARRGRDEYVAVDWERAISLVAGELGRVAGQHGIEAVYGGSYGWSSAGRFHHAQSQLHRFLNKAIGGYVSSVNNYSAGAALVILPHVLAPPDTINRGTAIWEELAAETELMLCFGGMAERNGMVNAGGITRHLGPGYMTAMRRRGCDFVLFGPLRSDLMDVLEAEWQPIRPASDTAVMLGMAHCLISEGLHDRDYLARYTVGFEKFAAYVMGETDGQAKDAEWASGIAEIPADDIRRLARKAAQCRTVISLSQSLQRAEHGEQPVWAAVTLAAMLGQIGKKGGGFYYALGAGGNVGNPPVSVPLPTLPQGRNNCAAFIPVARVADMLLQPGTEFDYNGRRLTYPDIKLVYWSGGNPFHHHQDLTRLEAAFARPETIIVHEPFWTATARRADIVLPCTVSLERDDIGASPNDARLLAMHGMAAPFGEARNEYEIFTDIAAALGRREEFTEGRSAEGWMRHLYRRTQEGLGGDAPDFDTFWQSGELKLPVSVKPSLMASFLAGTAKLATPSGKIEIYSETIASFGYADCLGHAAWLEPREWLGGALAATYPLQLISNQPATRLHSQLDFGACSQASKIGGREPICLHPADAAARGVRNGDVVRVFNARGAFLAAAVVSEDVRPGVTQIATGAWYDPAEIASGVTCLSGNPNAVTWDVGTSSLAQGCSGQLCLVEVERFDGIVPEGSGYEVPA